MLKQLKEWLKTELKDKAIFDLIVYGSAVKGKSRPNDLDIMVIFREGALKERLEKIQSIKKKIQFAGKIDIQEILLKELFEESFFGRTGIFLEGISVLDGKQFSSKIGFLGFSLFVYNLKDKTHTEKVKFNYVLSGRGSEGMVKKLNGVHLAPGAVQIPIKNSLEFEEVLKLHKVEYSKKNVLVED